MKRIFPDYAYSDGPRDGCWWDETCDMPEHGALQGDMRCDVAIIGGGFTGLSAALHLAQAGASVVLLEAQRIGWGASGRNGGFCCLGGAKASDAFLDRSFGRAGRLEWHQTEKAAVALVDALITNLDLDVDRHSTGETVLAHRQSEVGRLEEEAASIVENYDVAPTFLAKDQLSAHGFAGPFHAALTTPIGFALNPRKYLRGLLRASVEAGVRVFEKSAAVEISGPVVRTSGGRVQAEKTILGTNGYSSEDVPTWMASRYMPTQSTVLVTRPLTEDEILAQGWTSDQMAYDTRRLLHYFRLLPDRRFLIGMRGGLMSSPRSEQEARSSLARDFKHMFPAWNGVDITHTWSGFVCLSRNLTPFVGPVPGSPKLLAGFGFHGNGVAMGSYAGRMLADLALGRTPDLYPAVMRKPAAQFPLGRFRRAIMPPIYAALRLNDRGF
ncbi:NAD(P)/FAD-dependent oxidoreductase [Tateyamaria pelophila]|uniref:NAD(P)/FAD-dependent oxidoreductase n=1 Tax=Tateyamaria pelophila TaxID=328415 RepID=UPI001CBDA550|nr:FAD-binding oxidoreductase [Tateyamaria pelophila]